MTFARVGGTLNPKFQIMVKYIGPLTVFASGTATATIGIGVKPLAVRVLCLDPAGITLDLYGDGSTVVRLRDDARMSQLPGGPGRSHDLDAYLDQQFRSGTSLTVFDPKATPADLTGAPKAENPGANPQFTGKGFGADGWTGLLDGDGDQDKELELGIKFAPETPNPDDRKLLVTATQRSSKQARTAQLALPPGLGSWLIPHVAEVTDGYVPTKMTLFGKPDPALLLAPGVHSPATSSYRATLGGGAADLVFPAETTPRRKLGEAGAPQIAGGILAADITLGAYKDVWRLSFRQLDDGKTTFGLSAVNAGKARDTVGAELNLTGPIKYSPVDTGPTSIGIDLNGDGKPDLQIFDRLTTPSDVDGGGPPAQSRNHELRVMGPAIGAERTYSYQYRFGGMLGVNGVSGAVNTEAGRNAEAVTSLAEQGKTTTLDASLDQIEIAMLSMRSRAAKRGLLTQETLNTNLALWQALVRVRAQAAKGVTPALKDEALKKAEAFQAAWAKEVPQATFSQSLGAVLVTAGLRSGGWASALGAYSTAMTAVDKTIRDRMEKVGGESDKDLVEAKQLGQLRSELQEIPAGAKAIRVAGTYHPDEKFRSEQGYVSMLPLQLYAWKDDGEWKVKDVTNPSKPYTYSVKAQDGETLPPLRLFSELDDPDHYPAGAINVQVPGGVAGRIGVRDRLTWKKFFTYLGLTLAVIGVTLSVIASAGATSAAVPAAWALGASALAGATVAGIDLAEHIQHDNLDAKTAVLDLAQIVAGIATAGALAAGRIVVAAGSANAASRWTGAWAQAAMLAQRSYVPLVVAGASADVVTLAVMGSGLTSQLDAIEKGDADPGEKSRAKMLLLIQAATMTGLTALQLKGVGTLGRGETLVLTRGLDGVPVVSPALTSSSLIIDANIAIALRKRAAGEALQPGETALLKRYDAMNPTDVRVADTSIGEAAAKGGGEGPQRGFGVGVDRASQEYKDVFDVLEKASVGGKKGAADRSIVADSFFGAGESGVTPRYATMDEGVYKRLYGVKVDQEGATPLVELIKKNQKKGMAPPGLPDLFPNGFPVTIKGRTLHVLPMPKT